MSDYPIDADESENIASLAHGGEGNHDYRNEENRFVALSNRFLNQGDEVIYAIVGVCFFIGAFFALGYSFWDFGLGMVQVPSTSAANQPTVVVQAIIKLISDLLLVLIIMEVLGTVLHYLKAHATSLRPFLFIGIVSATRGILSIGARLSVASVTSVTVEEFTRSMIELGVSAAVILALGITLKLLGKLVED
jgi:uncharacterized membrane protein (DUF373 family)